MYMWDLGYITYSGKVFSVKFWGMVSFGAAKASNLRKCSLRKSYFFTNSRKFSAIWCLHGYTQYRDQPPTMNITRYATTIPSPSPSLTSSLPSSLLLLPFPSSPFTSSSGHRRLRPRVCKWHPLLPPHPQGTTLLPTTSLLLLLEEENRCGGRRCVELLNGWVHSPLRQR